MDINTLWPLFSAVIPVIIGLVTKQEGSPNVKMGMAFLTSIAVGAISILGGEVNEQVVTEVFTRIAALFVASTGVYHLVDSLSTYVVGKRLKELLVPGKGIG